jgi:phosphate transport system substrate-binding protein
MGGLRQSKTEVLIWACVAAAAVVAGLWFYIARVPEKSVSSEAGDVTATEKIKIGGSASAIPLMKILADEYSKKNPEVEVEFLPETHSRGGVTSVYEGIADIGVLSRTLSPEEVLYKVRFLHLANDVLVFAVHPSVKIENLTTEQIRHIYSGAITNWSQVGGPNHPITVLDRPEHTSPKIVLRELLLGNKLVVTNKAVILERPWQMNESLKSLPFSIGYTSLADIISGDFNVNILKIDGVTPSLANVESLKYKYFRPFGFVLGSVPSRHTMRLVNFIYSEDGSRIMENNGYAPVVMTLVIATLPERSILKQEERYRPLVQYLYRRLGNRVRIRLKHLPSYEQVVDEFMAGKVNAAFFGSFTYALAQAKVGVTAIARPVTNGVSQYRGIIFTRKDSGIENWRDLKGRSFTMIRATTAGEIFPKLYFKRQGVDLTQYLGKIVYVGSHDDSIFKVLYGEVDAGAAKDLIFYKLAQEMPVLNREIRILAMGFPVPENALTIRKDIDVKCFKCHARNSTRYVEGVNPDDNGGGDLEVSLREALLDLSRSEEGKTILRNFGADSFVKTTDEDYRQLYNSLKELGIDLNKY